MKFSDIVKQAVALLRESGRVTYRTLKREFALDDAALEDLKFELINGQRVAVDEEGKVLVWTGDRVPPSASTGHPPHSQVPIAINTSHKPWNIFVAIERCGWRRAARLRIGIMTTT